MRHLFRAAVLLSLISVWVGCSSDATPDGLCALFTREEIGELLGTPVEPALATGAEGTGCQWDGSIDDFAFARIHVSPDTTTYRQLPPSASRVEELSGIGDDAYVADQLGGWAAAAIADSSVAMVSVSGGLSSRETAVQLLRTLVERTTS